METQFEIEIIDESKFFSAYSLYYATNYPQLQPPVKKRWIHLLFYSINNCAMKSPLSISLCEW